MTALSLLPLLLLLSTVTLSAQPDRDEFAFVLRNFQEGVKRGDTWRIAALSRFPLTEMAWGVLTEEERDRQGTDLTRNDFLKRGQKFFDRELKRRIARWSVKDFERKVRGPEEDAMPNVPEGSVVYQITISESESSMVFYFVKFPGPESFYFIGVALVG